MTTRVVQAEGIILEHILDQTFQAHPRLIDYSKGLKVNSSLLTVILRD